MKKIFLSIGLMLGYLGTHAQAQHNIYALQYTMGFAMGDFNDFMDVPSFRGATFNYNKMLTNNLGVGMDLAWSAFYDQRDYDTYVQENGTASLSGKQYRYCSTVPMSATVNYYLMPGQKINAYAGVGIGTMYSSTELDMGIYAFTVDTWHFLVKPEAGIILQAGPGMGVIVAAKYYAAFETAESNSRNYLTANVGLAWGF